MDRASQLLATTLAFLVIDWITVTLRCFVRGRIVRSFGIDDWLIVISLAVYTILSGLLIAGIHHGIGMHNADVTVENITQALKYQTLSEIAYILDTATIKLSVGFLLTRFSPIGNKAYRYIIYSSMLIFTLMALITIFVVVFQCRPVSFAWDKVDGTGTCINSEAITSLGYAFSAIDIFFDWLFALLPVPMLWHVQMTMQIKISIFFILGMGVVASTATIVRLKYIVAVTDTEDILYSFATTLIWTVTEVGVSIAAASIATLRPLFRNLRIPGFSSTESQTNKYGAGGTDGYHRSYDLSYIHPTETVVKSSVTHTRRISENNSQESILGHDGIQKRMDVDVTYEAPV